MTESRGIRNNNPGNIRWGDNWQGLVPQQNRTDTEFCQFVSPEFGLRAMIIILRGYAKKPGIPGVGEDKIDTVREIISRWAPTVENDTDAYVRAVAAEMRLHPDEHFDITRAINMMSLVAAIIYHENGSQPYMSKQFADALRLAA